MTVVETLRFTAAEALTITDDLVDDPDCLAELEHIYSVFRFRYAWGTVYEITFSNLADGEDRQSCMRLMPADHAHLDTIDTNTLGVVGDNGVTVEVTHRFVTAHT